MTTATVTKQAKTNRTPIPFTDITGTRPPSHPAVPPRFVPTKERIYADGIIVRTFRSQTDHTLFAHLAWDIRKGATSLATYYLHCPTRLSTPGRAAAIFRARAATITTKGQGRTSKGAQV